MEGDDGIPVPGRVAQDGEAQAGAGDPGSQGGPGGHEGPGSGGSVEAEVVAREAEEVAREAAQVVPALDSPGPSADADADADAQPAPSARIRRTGPLHFIMLVPFRSIMEAQIARHLMVFSSQPEPGAAQQEVRVSGNRLAIRLTAQDMDQLRTSISTCLQEVFVLIETMQHIVPPFFFLSPGTMNGG